MTGKQLLVGSEVDLDEKARRSGGRKEWTERVNERWDKYSEGEQA